MGRQPATIRYANAAIDRADAVGRQRMALPSAFAFAVVLLLNCAGTLRAQTGIITTVVGPSLRDSSVNGASLQLPAGVAVDSAGSIYTADAGACVVWKTQSATSSVFAGILASSSYACGSGAATTVPTTTPLDHPVAVAQCNGDLFIASNGIDPFIFNTTTDTAGTVDEVDANGNLSALPLPGAQVVGGGSMHPVAVACDAKGNVYVSSYFYIADGGFAGMINEFSPVSGGTGWTTAIPASPLFDRAYPALAVNPSNGDLYAIVAGQAGEGWLGPPQMSFGSIGDITTNSSGLTSNNTFYNPSALAIDSNGNFYISTASQSYAFASNVEMVQPNGAVTAIAGTGTPGYNGDGIAGTQAEVNGVSGIAFDASGFIYLADAKNQRVRRIHSLSAGPQALDLVSKSVPQSSVSTYGTVQGVLNTATGDFYYVSGSNTVNVINSGANVISPGFERIIASVSVGAAGQAANGSLLTLVVDPTQDLVYVSNAADGRLYVINGATHTVVGSVSLNNPNARLLAIDTGLNEVYAGGPAATSVSAVRGGAAPQLIGNAGSTINSFTVDTATHVVYAVADTGAGVGTEEALITFTPDPSTGVLAVSGTTFPVDEDILQPAFIANSIAVDPESGSLIASGAASIDPLFAQTFDVYDIFQFTPNFITAPVPYTWPPLTTSLDEPNRAFYITDFDGTMTDPSSNTTMVTGIDGVAEGNNSLTSVAIPVFGSGATPASPHVYDTEPDTSSYQAWVSGSDATDGGFVKLWDAATKAVTLSVQIPGLGGGHIFVDSNAHAGYLLDHVNGQLWLINTPQWTTTPAPLLTQSQNGQSVTLSAANSGDAVYYTLDGSQPGLGSTPCISPCVVNLTVGGFTIISAIEVATAGSSQVASNVTEGVFTAPAPTSLSLAVSPSSGTTGATLTATATITPTGIPSVTGTVSFTSTPSGSTTPVSLCAQVNVTFSLGSFQAVCSFVETSTGSYTIAASYSGDALNQASSNTTPLTVSQGSTQTLSAVSGPSIALAINQNNSGNSYSAFLNSDSSAGLLQNGAIVAAVSCPAFTTFPPLNSNNFSAVSSGAVFLDSANSRMYLAMMTNVGMYLGYDSFNLSSGTCTQSALLSASAQFSNPTFGAVELNVDPLQGEVYAMVSTQGGSSDAFFIAPTPTTGAPWSISTFVQSLNLDYSATYGPILIDPSNHQVYINDLGISAYGAAGTYATSGFFVYDPNQSPTPANNLQHVVGYISGGVATTFNVGTLLTNGVGKLVLINANPSATSANLSVPVTVLDTTKFSFFTNTSNPFTYNNDVDITPGAGLTTISAVSQYSAIGAADIDAVNNAVYVFAYNASAQANPGLLLEYSLSPTANPQETVLSGSAAMPQAYPPGPWSQMNYDPESTELALSSSAFGSGSLGITSALCSGTPLSLTQLVGSNSGATPMGLPVVNVTSGYLYITQSGGIEYVAPPSGCGTATTTAQLSPPALTFNSQVVATTSTAQTVTLTNQGSSALTITGVSFTGTNPGDFAQGTTGTCGTSLAGGSSCTIAVTFTPAAGGSRAATLSVADSASNSPQTVSLTGTGVTVTLTPASLTFNSQVVGTTSTAQTVTLTNFGSSALTITGVSFTGTNLGDFAQGTTGTCGTSLAGGSSCTIAVTFTPSAIDTRTATLSVAESASSSPLAVSMTGTGVTVTLTPASLTFNSQLEGTTSATQTVTLSNPGSSALTITGISFAGANPGDFAQATSSTCGTSLAGGAICTIDVIFKPAASGTLTATLNVADSVTGSPQTVSLTGTGVAPVIVSPTGLTFSNQIAGTTSLARLVTLTNEGSSSLTITGVSFTGANPGDFAQGTTGTCGSSLAGGTSCTIAVTFTPAGSGTRTATLNVADSATNSPQTVSLTGTEAVCETITVTPATLAAGTSGTAYPSVTFTETGGVGATTFSETGTLPTGMTFVAPVLSGTPTLAGSFPIQVTATDSNGCAGSVSPTLTIYGPGGPPAQVTDNETIIVTDTETFPDVADSEAITVKDYETVTAFNAIAITPNPTAFSSSSGTGYATYAYGPVPFTASGGIGTLTLTESGTLPSGVTFSNGTLSGTPASASAGTYTFSVTAIDANGDSATLQGYSLTIQPASAFPAVVTDNETITVTDNETFPDVADSEAITVKDSETVTAFNAIAITPSPTTFIANYGAGVPGGSYGPVTFTATGGIGGLILSESGTLPAGLTFNNGVLGGTLSSSSSGTYTFSVTATDANGDQATLQGYTLNIATPLLPSLRIAASPNSLTIAQGQMGETTLTFTPSGGYSGTLALGCSGLPQYSLCVFSLNGVTVHSVTLTGNNQPVNVQLTFETDVNTPLARLGTTSTPARNGAILTAVAFWWPGSLLGLVAFRRKRKVSTKKQRWFGLCIIVLLTGTVAAGLAGCISSGAPLTPTGNSTVTVTVTPGSGTAQTLSIGITITQQ